jgi:DNA mismatch repair ATPase MutS
MPTSAVDFYTSRTELYRKKVAAISHKIKLFAWYRLFSFLLIFIPLIVWGWAGVQSIIPSIIFAALFIFLVKKSIGYENQKKELLILEKLSGDELLALSHQFSQFENGEDFLDTAHFNSYDLDLFGEGSLFQFLNRTSTQSGRQKLAGWLQEPFLEKTDIERRQEAVRELAAQPEWRLNFLANGHLFKESPEENEEVKQWSETELHLNRPALIGKLVVIVPALTMTAAIYAGFGGSYFWMVLLILTQWNLIFFSRKRVAQYYSYFGRKSELLGKYMKLVQIIETSTYKSSFLNELQIKVTKHHKASHIFRQLKNLVHQFEFRQNLIVNALVNSLLLWDLRCTYNLWKWHRQNHKKLAAWLDVIAETDALTSLSNLAYNHPEFTYPKIHEGGFKLEAVQLGHPLISPAKRVDNDLTIDGWAKVLIVTGANMAGKSTFLRTVGVNLILGRMGAPVCAKYLTYTPVEIYTNMRTTDSLLKDESYFFAELKRIKAVLDRLQSGDRIFVILDEMLKGTNSVDKLNGSRKLIKKLLELKAVALIATHDLKISELEEEYPQMVYNKCFEIKLEGSEMLFDYLLKEGVTKTMNATFLMKKMGII